MKAPKKVYVCSECDSQFPRWSGQCPSCRAWNTLSEETFKAPAKQSIAAVRPESREKAMTFSKMDSSETERIITGIGELDRVLGGRYLFQMGGDPVLFAVHKPLDIPL